MLAFIFQCLVIFALGWSTIARFEAWPFSSYPMFARYRNEPALKFFELNFIMSGNEVRSWPLSGGRLAADFHSAFETVWRGADSRENSSRVALEFHSRAVRFDPSLNDVRTVRVVLRLAQLGLVRGVTVVEQTVLDLDVSSCPKGA